MSRSFVKVEGLKELEKALRELPRATAKNVMVRALKAAAGPMVEMAQKDAPVLTGSLRDSIAVSSRKPKDAKSAGAMAYGAAMAAGASAGQARQAARAANSGAGGLVEVYVGPGQNPQAIAQEFGTARHPPQPFMRPAWDANKDGILASIKDLTWSEIEKAAKRLARKTARLAAKAAKVARRHAAG